MTVAILNIDWQPLADALALGGVYALMAVGIGLVFGVLRLVNFAYGQLIMAGAYALAFASQWNMPGWLGILFAMTFPMSDEDRSAYLAAWSQSGALTGGLNYYRAARLGPPTGEEATGQSPNTVDPAAFVVRVPTLVIWGERDPALLTGNLDGLEQFVPALTVKRIPDGTHWVIHEHPGEVNAAIRAFMG